MTRSAIGLLAVVACAGAVLGTWTGRVGADGERPRGALVARVGGETIDGARLSAYIYDRQRESWLRALDDLVDETIVMREARRLGVVAPSAVVAESVRKEAEAREKQIQRLYGEEVSLAEEVRRAYGLDLAGWKREILEPRIRTQHLLMRIVRLDTRRRPRIEIRVIVVPSEARAQAVRRKLDSGADFSLIAVKESADPTASSGGVLPAVARGDLAWPEIEARLFEAAPGAVLGPFPVDEEGARAWHLYKLIRKVDPWTGGRRELFQRLEKDLEDEPLQRPEFERWRARMRRDFRVEIFTPDGAPLLRTTR